MMTITPISQKGIIPTFLSLAVIFYYRSLSVEGFLSNGPLSGRRIVDHQRAEIFFVHGSSSRMRSLLNNDNTRSDMEDNVLLLPLLEAELVKLKGSVVSTKSDDDDEDSQQQRIRELQDKIDNAKTAAEFGVRRVQAEFYDAFSNADYEKMSEVWSSSDDVCCAHPGMHSLQGIDRVMQSWKQIFAAYSVSDDKDAFQIDPSRVKVEICGRTAICTCIEKTNGGRLEALNIYRREEGTWKMVNHMASPVMMGM